MAIVTAHVAAVQQLYVAYFNRPADYAGLDYWTNVVEAQKGSTAAVSAAFAAEAEYKTEYANLSNADVVNKVYQNLFGRAAEDAGKKYWADLLDAKQITIDKVVAEIAKGARTTDLEAYENKVAGATAFTAALDTKPEQDGYKGAAANTEAKAFISGITTDASLTAAIAPETLSATVVKVVAAGTPFTVVGALQTLEAANKAKADFLASADGDNDAKTSTTDAALATDVTTKDNAVEALLVADARPTYDTGSAAVKAALIADQQTLNANALTTATTAVATANTNIAKVAGLAAAVNTVAAATTAKEAAVKVQSAAAADLAAKLAFYNTTNGAGVTVAADGTVTGLIEVKDNKLVLVSGVTETTNPGVTALLNSSIAQEAADLNVTKATTTLNVAQNTVDYLDRTAGEAGELETIRLAMTDVVVASGNVPTEAQIAEQLAIFKAKDTGASTTYEDFQTLVDNFYNQIAGDNPLAEALATAEGQVKTANTNIKNFTEALAKLTTAQNLVTQGKALDATVAAATKVFTDKGYAVQNVDQAAEIGSSASDIFVAGKVDSTISLFGLQGSDSLFIGSNFTLNKGALSTGNNAVLEAFVSQSGSDAVIKLEKSVFGSAATTPEVVTITLVGVDAAAIQLNNGIITVGTAAA
jgi:hypothetical protein